MRPRRCKAGLIFALVLVSSAADTPRIGAAEENAGPLTSPGQIRALSPGEADRKLPVHLRAVVSALDSYQSTFFVMDSTGGVYVDRRGDTPPVSPGLLVELTGYTESGQFAPIVFASEIKVIGKRALPPPRLFSFSELSGGREDSQWVALRGLVRSASTRTLWGHPVLVLETDTGQGNLVPVDVYDASRRSWKNLPGSIVEMHGVCGTAFNDKKQFVGVRLYVTSLGDIVVEEPAPSDPFNVPEHKIGSLLQFNVHESVLSRVKVRGVVTYARPGEGIYLQDGSQGIFVRGQQQQNVAVGALVEAVGYPTPGGYSPMLDNALYRAIGQPPVLPPVVESADAMIVSGQYPADFGAVRFIIGSNSRKTDRAVPRIA